MTIQPDKTGQNPDKRHFIRPDRTEGQNPLKEVFVRSVPVLTEPTFGQNLFCPKSAPAGLAPPLAGGP
jgi:hypothetical protein